MGFAFINDEIKNLNEKKYKLSTKKNIFGATTIVSSVGFGASAATALSQSSPELALVATGFAAITLASVLGHNRVQKKEIDCEKKLELYKMKRDKFNKLSHLHN